MTSRIFTWSLIVVMLVLAYGYVSRPSTTVLFVGNSYTQRNAMAGMVSDLAATAGERVTVVVRAPGGWWWRDHANSSETIDLIRSGDFDFVVLQEQSMVPSWSDMARLESRPAAIDLANAAVGSGARVVLYMTWGHRNGFPEAGHANYESMQIAIANTYWDIGGNVLGEVAPVGVAWWMVREERPDIALYEPDGSHPTEAGSYLAAAVITATLLDIEVIGLERPLGLDPATAETLPEFADRAVGGEVPWR